MSSGRRADRRRNDDPLTTTLATTTSIDDLASSNLHRGFSTSIFDLFSDPAQERVDCCALTCCGVLQNDRDRYLVQGIRPPGPLKRCTVHFLFPASIFMMAGLVATHVADVRVNQIASTVLVLALLLYLYLQCYKGRSKRIEIRKDLLYLKYQIQNQPGGGGDSEDGLLLALEHHRPLSEDEDNYEGELPLYYLGQSKRDFQCAHPCCLVGFYADDRKSRCTSTAPDSPAANPNSSLLASGATGGGANSSGMPNLCRCLYTSVCSWPCTGNGGNSSKSGRPLAALCCGMHVQLCGLCAIAQEAREIENVLLPPSYRRIDYVTMQAMTDYYPAIYRAKWKEEESPSEIPPGDEAELAQLQQRRRRPLSFLPPLSRLSYRLLQGSAIITSMLLLWSIVGPLYWRFVVKTRNRSHMFGILDFLIYLLTISQSVGVLALIVWYINRCRNTSKINPDLSTDAIIKYFASGFCLSTSLAIFWELLCSLILRIFISILMVATGVDALDDPEDSSPSRASSGGAFLFPSLLHSAELSSVKDFMEAFGNDHPTVYTIYIFFNAFCLAALIEELCKYFGFRMIEHPDFLSKRDLEEASRIVVGENNETLDDDDENEWEDEILPRGRSRSTRRSTNAAPPPRVEVAPPDYSKQRRSIQAQGAAITLAMISVAMGFTCCENLVYCLLYSSSSPKMELAVLLSRSLFPVHPIAAAIQSIGVCRRELEGSRVSTLGRIILPAVIFHGSYDFFLLWIDFLARRNGVYAGAEDDGQVAFDQGSIIALAVSFLVSILIMCGALYHLFRSSNAQRKRLADMDRQQSVDRSRLI